MIIYATANPTHHHSPKNPLKTLIIQAFPPLSTPARKPNTTCFPSPRTNCTVIHRTYQMCYLHKPTDNQSLTTYTTTNPSATVIWSVMRKNGNERTVCYA